MSWLSVVLNKFGFSSVSFAYHVANDAIDEFRAYAATDEYVSLFEFVADLESMELTGTEKLALALDHARSDIEVYGKFVVRQAIEAICGQIKKDSVKSDLEQIADESGASYLSTPAVYAFLKKAAAAVIDSRKEREATSQ